MKLDKFSALWISHSKLNDFANCPRLFYLRNIYKDPITGHKITRIEPALTLGQTIHDVIDQISTLPKEQRLKTPLVELFKKRWSESSGKVGGFRDKGEEDTYFARGLSMITTLQENPGVLLSPAIKIKEELPFYWLSEDENIILCGKVDWLEYLSETDSVHIVDFKTGKYDEGEDSLQLPIYLMLVRNTQKRNVSKASYWYLDRENTPREVPLPDTESAFEKILTAARRIKLAKQLDHFTCKDNGCRYCAPLEAIKSGKGEKVGVSQYKQDLYVLF